MTTVSWTCVNCNYGLSVPESLLPTLEGKPRKVCSMCGYDSTAELSGAPAKPAIPVREPDLVRAELVDALNDYASIFREKAEMETFRASQIEAMSQNIAKGGAAIQPDIHTSQDFARKYQLLEMRHNELKIRVERLILEHGNN